MTNRCAKRRLLQPVCVLLVSVAGITLLASCGSSRTRSVQTGFHAAGVLAPPALAPPLALRNYLGQSINIDAYRGEAVLVTFIYTHCPNACPLIVSNLRVAQNLMGPKMSSKVHVVAVSVDPRGDTPKSIAAFLARREMTGRMQYLIGSAAELARVWRAWGVGSERDAGNPELVNHSGLVFGIGASGKRTTIYEADFRPADIAHDAPLLASR